MAKQSKLISETTMYSIDKVTGDIVSHHLPWPRTSPQLETYIARGFTFERPDELEPQGKASYPVKEVKIIHKPRRKIKHRKVKV